MDKKTNDRVDNINDDNLENAGEGGQAIVGEDGKTLIMIKKPGLFWKDFLFTFDIVSIVTLILYIASGAKFLGLEAALCLGVFYLVRGIGHFWGLRLCRVFYKKMRFIPFIGGYIETLLGFKRRHDEAFCALMPSIAVLITSLCAFAGYMVAGNLHLLMYAWISMVINAFAILPFVPDLDGAAVVKSITFSISRSLGLTFLMANAFIMPSFLYLWRGVVDYMTLIPLVVAGLQRFSEEYNRILPIEPMNERQMKTIGGVYLVLLGSFLILPKALGISSVTAASMTMLWPTIAFGVLGLLILGVLESNAIVLLTLKRKLFN